MALEKLEIVILADNSVNKPGKFTAEYGFAAYVKAVGDWEVGVLFDTGCGIVLEDNMLEAGISWEDIDYVALSHRHFDHTGGLLKVVENCRAPIVAHPDVFKPNFLWMRNRLVEGTMPYTRMQLESRGARFILTREPFKFIDGLIFGGEIPRVSKERIRDVFTLEDGRIVQDSMMDDTALFAATKKGGVVLTGCAHSGIINTVLRGKELMGNVYAALGGFHLMFSPPDTAEKVMEKVMEVAKIVAPTHCSGGVAQSFAMKAGADRFIQLGSGAVVKF